MDSWIIKVTLLLPKYNVANETIKATAIQIRRHAGNTILRSPLKSTLEEGFTLFLKVPLLQIVYYCHMIDVLATLRFDLVTAGIIECLVVH